jgi:predicted transcriptional regulator
MSTLEIKQELHRFIDTEDDKVIKKFYKMAKAYMEQLKADRMIAEGEEDIKAGRLHSQQEVKDFIKNWKP